MATGGGTRRACRDNATLAVPHNGFDCRLDRRSAGDDGCDPGSRQHAIDRDLRSCSARSRETGRRSRLQADRRGPWRQAIPSAEEVAGHSLMDSSRQRALEVSDRFRYLNRRNPAALRPFASIRVLPETGRSAAGPLQHGGADPGHSVLEPEGVGHARSPHSLTARARAAFSPNIGIGHAARQLDATEGTSFRAM
jgi:hypothetical protein